MKILRKLASPMLMERVHLVFMALWVILVFPSILFWKDSVPYLVAISVYAVITGHLASWQAARVERLEKEKDGGTK